MFKGTAEVSGTPEKLSSSLWSLDEETMKQWDEKCLKWNAEELADNVKLICQETKLPWPLWNRDLTHLWSKHEEGDDIWHVWRETEHPDHPERPKEFVRAKVLLAAAVFKKADDNKTTITRLVHVDPAGNVPSSFVNSQATNKVAGFISNLEKLASN
mmetsp:Transcript_11119/g.16687  ORF Transcript_11119/g.16687 Transcript_11119/m.16687 type:complete len:157 (+) Transcript_11119:180-650(+)